MPLIIFVLRDGSHREVAASVGQTLLEVAKANKIDIEGACGGAMACATCHLIVDSNWFKKLPAAEDEETDMLDLAPGLTRTSRLGCQIVVTDNLSGLIVKLPQSTTSFVR